MRALFGVAALLIVLAIIAVVASRQTRRVALVVPGPAASGAPADSTREQARTAEQQVTRAIGQAKDAASGARSRAEEP